MAFNTIAESAQPNEIARRREYMELVLRVRDLTESCVPEGATVALVSKGDSDLLRLQGRVGWHFPRTPSGEYAGHHPADDADAIARLEATRADGATFLVLPATSFWWLDHYVAFTRHLDSRYRRVVEHTDTAIVFSLADVSIEAEIPADRGEDAFIQNLRAIAAGLLPAGATVLVATGGDDRFLDLGGPSGWHFPQGASGSYTGVDPVDGRSAVGELEVLRRLGAEFLLFPRSAYWWLDRYADFRHHLQERYPLVTRQENVCTIYDLRGTAMHRAKSAATRVKGHPPVKRVRPRKRRSEDS